MTLCEATANYPSALVGYEFDMTSWFTCIFPGVKHIYKYLEAHFFWKRRCATDNQRVLLTRTVDYLVIPVKA